jgi:V/A-type H+-transporting ATPase subunit C
MGLTDLDISYATARVRGLKGRFLKPGEILELAQGKTLSDFAASLEETEYHGVIKNIDKGDIHAIETQFYSHLAEREKIVLSITPQEFKHLIEERITRNEITLLKDLVYSKEEGRGSPKLKDYTFLLTEKLFRIHVHLLEAEDVHSLINALKNTRYHRPLMEVYGRLKGDFNPIPYDAVLDRLYYLQLLEEAGKLPREERNAVSKLLGEEADHVNLLVHLRCMNIGLPPKDYAIPLHSRFYGKLEAAVDVKDVVEALGSLNLGERREAFTAFVRNNDVFSLEVESKKRILHANRRVFLEGSEGACTLLAYLALKEAEVRNLWGIAAGKINNLPYERIRKALAA